MENTNGIVQASHGEIMSLKAHLSKIEARIEEISTQVQKATFATVMAGSDISEFFPVERLEQLELFMDRSHPEWPSRKTEFYNLLFTTVPTTKRGFAKGLIKALFDRKFIVDVKWPSFGYYFFFFYLKLPLLFKKNHSNHYRPRKNKSPVVPMNFVAFLRASLSKMVGYHYLKPDLIDLDFWAKLPLKFSAVKFYDKSVVR